MPEIVLETTINASPDICFDLMRDKRVHKAGTFHIEENAGGEPHPQSVWLGQSITFYSTFLGIKQKLTLTVTKLERPSIFVDEMTDGSFRSFVHIHELIAGDRGTLLRDTLAWSSPFGVIGKLTDTLLIKRRLVKVVTHRNARLKSLAEAAQN